MLMKCPNCSAEVEFIEGESELCSECGSELKDQTQNEQHSSVTLNPTLSAGFEDKTPVRNTQRLKDVDFAGIFAEINKEMASSRQSVQYNDLSMSSKAKAGYSDDTGFRSSSFGGCPYLEVEYNRNLFFLTDSESVMKLRLTPKSKELQHLLIFMESQRHGNNTRRQIPVRELLQENRSFYLQVPYNPGQAAGRLSLVFYIGCKVNGKFEYYQFSVEHKIYDANQSGSSLCRQININQEFSTQHAGTIHASDSIGEALKTMADKMLTVNEMVDRLNDLPPIYQAQFLSETTWRPEDVLVKGHLYPADRLILEWNGKTLFLFNKNSIRMGRDLNHADLLVRTGQGRLGPREYPNSTVSRTHAEIVYCEDTVKIFDLSSYGTYINGRKPDSAGIPLDNSCLVEFGDIHWQMNIQTCHMRLPHNICQTCTANKVKSVTFTRKDDEPEYYLLIWQCCELGRVIEELSDWTIFTRGGSFFIRTPDQDFYHLRPGQPIEANNQKINVKYFQQS